EDIMPLADELAFIKDYLFLIGVRFGEDYYFDVRKEQATEGRYLPSGALQTAIENVVKHNAVDGQQIRATILVANEVVTISNSKGGRAEVVGTGTGLHNLSSRYDLLGARVPIVEDLPERYTLKLPLLLTQTA
ncbi:MAG: hypothetical protein AAGA31_12040, partial [Bacteroidota bacterium]